MMVNKLINFSWTCLYCGQITTVTDADHQYFNIAMQGASADGLHQFHVLRIVCPNPLCKRMTLTAELFPAGFDGGAWGIEGDSLKWNLVPSSTAKVFPDYIPEQIRGDYEEACIIVNLSPKASASMSRRCLQGMIRHFWGVAGKRNLYSEMNAIKDIIDPLIWIAIDGVRDIGNIGAHMEQDVDLIIDVEPGEAEALINLIEMLFKDWYITKHEREENLISIQEIAASKEAQQNSN